jgi:hypothetical protein
VGGGQDFLPIKRRDLILQRLQPIHIGRQTRDFEMMALDAINPSRS